MRIGASVAVITPFKNDEVDYQALGRIIEFQIEKGIHSIVPCGTTGESATLSLEEHEQVIEFVVEKVNKRIPVITGAGSNNTKEAIRLTKHAKKIKADAVLSITPYYNKPTQQGLYEHFKAISETIDIPIVMYNVPGRTGVNMLPETVARCAELKNIIGIKEASGDINQITEIIRICPPSFQVISGDDGLTYPILCLGGKGVISVIANIVPDRVAKIVNEFDKGNILESRRIHLELIPLVKVAFIETNPIPIKTAASLLGLCEPELRLPLYKMQETNKQKLISVLKNLGIYNS
ncbi:MAG TPA: 4-hydroxy-tetrahydrodipicolinate synthase [bacterium]|nr:4-hydroxy-tetrahydrodipicolinate synthase [bacterium]HOL48714.1 4-hydroxy-tetrahydrodipicolinate synthase [bacterium]HPQ20015.1 4-hydroxy-tetrahydrodipicolinate synthase [bacterium]